MASSSLLAESKYLECYTEYGGDRSDFTVKIDEDSGKITHTDGLGAYNTEGFFGPNEIRYKYVEQMVPSIVAVNSYEIDRTTLDIVGYSTVEHTDLRFGGKADPIGPLVGKCEIVEVKDRKI
jgi:hypothetical protein